MMTTCKEEARRWVHLYAIGGAAFAALPVPISTTAALAALEAHMFSYIGSIYGEQVGSAATAAADVTFTVMGQGLRFLVHRAVGFIPVLGPLIRAGIAAATIESIGHGIVGHFERKNPGKLFTRV
jgi:uncharacterized protein (DUF697 family)